MDIVAYMLIIFESYVCRNNFTTRKASTNKWSTMTESFPTSRKAKITLKIPELDVTAHISGPFDVMSKKLLQCDFWLRFTPGTRNSTRFPK